MTTKEDKLLAAKTKVCSALGDNAKIYLANLKFWFRKIWTKEQFDLECRKLFSPEQKHLHNEFLIAIINKITAPLHSHSTSSGSSNCSGMTNDHNLTSSLLSKSGKKRKRSSRPTSERAIFEPVELYDYLPEDNLDLRPPTTPLSQPRYAAQELFLPDNGLIMGRLLVAAWENGLMNADENVCELVVIAVQVSIIVKHKSIRMHLILNKFVISDVFKEYSVCYSKISQTL